MTTLSSLVDYSIYSSYNKCGEILKSPSIDEKQQYCILCLFCHEICLQFKTFVVHIEKEHHQQDHILKDEQTSDEDDQVNAHFSSIQEFENEDSGEDDKKDFLLDPLEEPEVQLKENRKHREKNNTSSKPQTRQAANEGRRKSNQSKKQQDKLIKQEPDENDEGNNIIDSPKTLNLICNAEDKCVTTEAVDKKEELQLEKLKIKADTTQRPTVYNEDIDYDYEEDDDDFVLHDNYDDEDCDLDDVKVDDDDELKPSPAKKSKVKLDDGLDIDEFMNNKESVIAFITAYQKQDELWDATRPPKLVNRCRKKRDECLKQICQELEQVNVPMTIRDAEKCIKYMRVRYIRDVRIRMNYTKNKDKDYKPLWFYDNLEFLKPTLSFIQELQEEQMLAKPKLNDDQIIRIIQIYRKYSCLWNEQDIFYYSEQRRQTTLQSIIEEVRKELQLNYSGEEMENTIEFIHKIVKKEKEKSIDFSSSKPSKEYKSTSNFYEHISFLLPHLGPFKCQYCPKVLMNIATFRIHTAKHDGTKPFKCSICNYEFTQKPGYVIHLRRHTQDFPFVCKYCSKGFPCKKELKLHFQNHPEYEKEFICDICGEGFTQQKLLNWHLKAHNNIRDSICNICGKGFTNSKLLFQHRTVHSQEKSVCKLCGKTYAHYRGLSRHMTKDHGTTVAAVAAVMGEKPKKRVLTINEIS
ncbi:zinc finger protein 615-like isoform X1 [Musca domestica]|uniref:Zinc finger protein 615-like isoform X1 n=1 Tax=Musca domestica TaxID=7370 RepID=A0ABM3VD69_MUSDO|nr:zinc finger protein 615-like isoform X1 [Musca domestica]